MLLKAIDQSKPWAYFDSSMHNGRCGGGVVLYLNNNHYFKLKSGLGSGMNNISELYNLK